MTSRQYKVYVTPRTDEFTYGTEVEISAEIIQSGLKTMKKSIDSGDYEVGVYTYGDISLKAINKDGYLSGSHDGRSIFSFSRDLAKIRIVYSDADGDSTRFKGLINEEATKEDFDKEEITFKVLSLDSVLRTTRVPSGVVANGVSASSAMKSILDRDKITSVLTFSAANINPANDITIDVGTEFDNLQINEAINNLLVVTNSVFVIDSSDNMIIKSRENSTSEDAFAFYGPYDEKMRQNIISLKKYNNGLHRTFTSISLNGTVNTDLPKSLGYGFRQKKITFDFITTTATETSIAAALVTEFATPKIEMEIEVETGLAVNIDLLSTVSVNYPLRLKRYEGSFLPIVGDTKIGDTEMKLPYKFGNNFISPDIAFKVIEISENPKNFTTILKLRQTTDGFLTSGASSYVGFAVIGESVIS